MRDFSALPRPPVLVLAGGNALGAFQAGAYQALHENGLLPDWMIGASIGAVNGALIVGNPVERRLETLQAFWSKAALPTGLGWGSAQPFSPSFGVYTGRLRLRDLACHGKPPT